MGQKIFVGSLAFATTSDGLRTFFSQAGTVVSANVITDQFSGQSRGFGFVEMESSAEADRAIAQLNGRDLDGRRLTVAEAKPKANTSDGSNRFGDRRGGWR